MSQRVFVTGASGFVGAAVISDLLARGAAVTALSHHAAVVPRSNAIRELKGDLFDDAVLSNGLAGCDAVIHLVGIIEEKPARGVTFEKVHVEGTRAIAAATRRAGIRRYVHMSALGTRPQAASTYHRTKWEAEQIVRASGLDWTIIRPSMIHGPGGFMKMESAWARKAAPPFVVMPYFGSGLLGLRSAGLIQPVYVRDVARAFADALEKPQTVGQTYELAGPERMDWPQFHRVASQALIGRSRLTAPVPAWLAKGMAAAALGPLLGFNRDQIIMSQEDNTTDLAAFQASFGWSPRSLRDSMPEYVGAL